MTSAMWAYMEASYKELQTVDQQQRTLSIKVMMLIAKVRGTRTMYFVYNVLLHVNAVSYL